MLIKSRAIDRLLRENPELKERRFGLPAIGTRNDGVKTASFAVIRPTEYIGILLEVAYMTNPIDSVLYSQESFPRDAANGIADGILRYITE